MLIPLVNKKWEYNKERKWEYNKERKRANSPKWLINGSYLNLFLILVVLENTNFMLRLYHKSNMCQLVHFQAGLVFSCQKASKRSHSLATIFEQECCDMFFFCFVLFCFKCCYPHLVDLLFIVVQISFFIFICLCTTDDS